MSETGPMKPYGPPIRDAVASGDTRQMREVEQSARQWLERNSDDPSAAEVRSALSELQSALNSR